MANEVESSGGWDSVPHATASKGVQDLDYDERLAIIRDRMPDEEKAAIDAGVPEVDPSEFAPVHVNLGALDFASSAGGGAADDSEKSAEQEIYGRISRAYDNLADGKGNPFAESGDAAYGEWMAGFADDPAYTALQDRVSADGGKAAEALERANAIAYETGLHPVEVMAAAHGMGVSEYASEVLGPQNIAEGPSAETEIVLDSMADFHGWSRDAYEVYGDRQVDLSMGSLAESAMGVGHNLRDENARFTAERSVEVFEAYYEVGAPKPEYDTGKSELANEVNSAYSDMSIDDRVTWGHDPAGTPAIIEAMRPADMGGASDKPSIDYSQYSGSAHAGEIGWRDADAAIDKGISGDDFASRMLNEHLHARKASVDAGDAMAWVSGGSTNEALAALEIADRAKANGVHPLEQAAHDAGMDVADYARDMAAEIGMEGRDVSKAQVLAMQSVAEYHNMTAEQYVESGRDLASRACSGHEAAAQKDWSEEAELVERGGTISVPEKPGLSSFGQGGSALDGFWFGSDQQGSEASAGAILEGEDGAAQAVADEGISIVGDVQGNVGKTVSEDYGASL